MYVCLVCCYSGTMPGGLLLIEFQSWVDLYTAFASLEMM